MNPPHPRTLLDGLFASEQVARIFSDHWRLQGMLDFEAALARSEARLGVIPPNAATVIASQCDPGLFDLDALTAGAARAGNVAIPLIQALTDRVAHCDPEASRSVHWGATSQDAIDTGAVLQLRHALDRFDDDLSHLGEVLADLARRHQRTILLGRTWLQPAPPVTFGLKVAGWLSAIERQLERQRELRRRVLVVQFGGAVGTLASLGEQALPIAHGLAADLGLAVPDMPWHTQRDRVAETAAVLGLLAGSLGKIARDVSLMMQPEVAEAFERRTPGWGGSSTMPHKHNPVGAAVVLAAATRVPPLVATVLAAMPQEHERGLGGWQAEWDALPEICLLCSGALEHTLRMVEGLEVDGARMRANLDATCGVVLAEPIALALARHMDRAKAHDLVARACRHAMDRNRPLREVLLEETEIASHLSAQEIDRLSDPEAYLGLADAWVERVLASFAGERGSARE
jgi:3-carboxy-cis,cis-muconate cycloisomerase